MIGLLQSITCLLQNIALAVLWALVEFLNQVIEAVAAAVVVVMNLLPDMPDFPDTPDNPILAGINWIFPVDGFVGLLGTMLLLWLGVLAVRILARWVKAL